MRFNEYMIILTFKLKFFKKTYIKTYEMNSGMHKGQPGHARGNVTFPARKIRSGCIGLTVSPTVGDIIAQKKN